MADDQKRDENSQPKGYSDAPINPGYPLDKALQEKSLEDLKRGYGKGGR